MSTTSTLPEAAVRVADGRASSLATRASVGALERTRTGTNVALFAAGASRSSEQRLPPAQSLDAHHVNVPG
jgi:hypothetical protein